MIVEERMYTLHVHVVSALSCLVFGSPAAGSARSADEAASFPSRPIRILVGFTPGGQPDIVARVIGPKLYEALGQQVVVDNRPGAGGTIATKTMTGRVQFFMAPIGSSVTLVKDGKLRALGVSTRQRARILPDIPTIAESGLAGFQWESWGGLITSAKTPRSIVDKLNREITRVLSLPDVQQRLTAIGLEPAPSTPAEFDKMIAEQLAVVAELARSAGIKPQ